MATKPYREETSVFYSVHKNRSYLNRGLALCEWRPIEKYSLLASQFVMIYRHLSTNDYYFDLECFSTWFVFDEFVQSEGIKGPIVCLDHDVLLYCDIAKVFEKRDFDIATTGIVGNQYTLFRTPAILHGYIAFMQKMYSESSNFIILENIYRTKKSPVPLPGNWICDMTLLGMYTITLGDRWIDLAEEHEGTIFDYAVGIPEGFDYNPYKKIKRLYHDRRGFYGRRDGHKLYFEALHFQVGAKVFLPHYYIGQKKFKDNWRHEYSRWRGRATTVVKWVLSKLSFCYQRRGKRSIIPQSGTTI